jgi:plastocyanin
MKTRITILAMAVVLALAAGVAAETHVVQVMNFQFSPRDLTINTGDIVRWQWVSGVHTTTNGLGSSDAAAGTLWDEIMSSGNQVFERQFNDPGTFPFFCRPHEFGDMKGTIIVQLSTDIIEETGTMPGRFSLAQNYPNPFNPVTRISFNLPVAAAVQLKVYNIMGGEVTTLVDRDLESGEHTAFWDGRDASGAEVGAGVYFYRLTTREFVSTRKMVFMK